MQVDLNRKPFRRQEKTKPVLTFDLYERRDMKHLFSRQRVVRQYLPAVAMGAEIAMPLTEGVVHLGQNGAQFAVPVTAEP